MTPGQKELHEKDFSRSINSELPESNRKNEKRNQQE